MSIIIKDPTADQAARILNVPVQNVRQVYRSNARHLLAMANQAALRRDRTYRGFSEAYLRERAASYLRRAEGGK